MSKTPKVVEPIIHKDAIGQELALEDIVAMPISTSLLRIGRIKKISAKTIQLIEIDTKSTWRSTSRKYPSEVVKLEGSYVTRWLLSKE